MLGNADAVANVAVKDMTKARAFYEGVSDSNPSSSSKTR